MAYTLIFLLKKMWVATHIFFSKNTCELDIVLTRTVNILTTKELVKLTMLWTMGPDRFFTIFINKTTFVSANFVFYTPNLFWKGLKGK